MKILIEIIPYSYYKFKWEARIKQVLDGIEEYKELLSEGIVIDNFSGYGATREDAETALVDAIRGAKKAYKDKVKRRKQYELKVINKEIEI